jgi:hypothetical protein
LTTGKAGLQYRQFASWCLLTSLVVRIMNLTWNLPIANLPPRQKAIEKMCRHTRVRVVAREEDVEFVECQECGDVFEASEFKDMAIEDNIKQEEA